MTRELSLLLHGDSGAGKSRLGDTAPAPRLFVDAEGGSRFLESNPKVGWDPLATAPPVADGSWPTCVATITEINQFDMLVRWIESRQHPFRSVNVDTLTEVQARCLKSLIGLDQARIQDWGDLLRIMEDYVRRLRDCALDPNNPLEVLVVICQTHERGEAQVKQRPAVRGQLGEKLPQFLDVVGHLYTQYDDTFTLRRALRVQPLPTIVAKDRTGRLGEIVWDPNIGTMLDAIYGPNGQGGEG